jgi:GDP-L-fucose synthase
MIADEHFKRQFRLADRRVWVAGHSGLVGQALLRRLSDEDCELLTCSREQVDLRAAPVRYRSLDLRQSA